MVISRTKGSEPIDGKTVERSQTFFDPWLVCDDPAITACIEEAVTRGEEDLARSRVRKRRAEDREAFHGIARSLVSNAAYAIALGLAPPTVGISLAKPSGKRSRYDGPSLRQLDAVLPAISPDLVTITRSRLKGIASVLEPGAGLTARIAGLPDFGPESFRQAGGETVILRRVERDYAADSRQRDNVEYEDTAETRRMRSELERINSALEAANLSLAPPMRVNTRQRRLRRIFNTDDDTPRFDRNGRLHGGWWQGLERKDRHAIRIDGEPVADLDFSAMFLRLAYADAGLQAPDGDLYAGILGDDFEPGQREGVKQVVNAMLFRTSPLTRLPKGGKELLPSGMTARGIRAAILHRHRAIEHQFERGVGLSLMRAESDIMVAVLLRLIARGIVALQMYDGLMVRRDLAEEAAEVMRVVAYERTGFRFPVREKALEPA